MKTINYSLLFQIIRVETSLSQKALAKILNISPGSIYKYENNIMKPGVDVIQKIKKYCNEQKLYCSLFVLSNQKQKELKGNHIIDLKYIIKLQKYKIKQLQKAINGKT